MTEREEADEEAEMNGDNGLKTTEPTCLTLNTVAAWTKNNIISHFKNTTEEEG
jgi:hypothetical protein